MNKLLPDGVRGLVLAALVCALISALDATMNSVSTLFVRDFVLRFRPQTSERAQVFIGRWAIAVCTAAGVAAAYLVYKTPDGLYKYLADDFRLSCDADHAGDHLRHSEQAGEHEGSGRFGGRGHRTGDDFRHRPTHGPRSRRQGLPLPAPRSDAELLLSRTVGNAHRDADPLRDVSTSRRRQKRSKLPRRR